MAEDPPPPLNARAAAPSRTDRRRAVVEDRPILDREAVARWQLDAAIRNFFRDGDMVAAHLLGWAALDVISDVAKSRGVRTLRQEATALMAPDFRKAWKAAERDHYNFFKHADRDPERRIRLLPDMTTFAVYVGCRDFLRTFGDQSPLMAIYSGWYLIQNPDMRRGFGADYQETLHECFRPNPAEAWDDALAMVEVAVEHPEAISPMSRSPA